MYIYNIVLTLLMIGTHFFQEPTLPPFPDKLAEIEIYISNLPFLTSGKTIEHHYAWEDGTTIRWRISSYYDNRPMFFLYLYPTQPIAVRGPGIIHLNQSEKLEAEEYIRDQLRAGNRDAEDINQMYLLLVNDVILKYPEYAELFDWSEYATPTPVPSATPVPTNTPLPTNTQVPTVTKSPTPIPTATIEPTDEPAQPTMTPMAVMTQVPPPAPPPFDTGWLQRLLDSLLLRLLPWIVGSMLLLFVVLAVLRRPAPRN